MLGAVRVKLAETPSEWRGAVAVRLAVFVDEQRVPPAAELDEHDRSALHAVAVLQGLDAEREAALMPVRSGTAARAASRAGRYLPLSLTGARGSVKDTGGIAAVVGTGRLRRSNESATRESVARIGRLAVLPAWRSRGVGSRLLRILEEAALASGARAVSLHAQLPAQAFYARRGYTVDLPGEVFQEDNIPHVRMTKPLSREM